jgi:hypothetical protein
MSAAQALRDRCEAMHLERLAVEPRNELTVCTDVTSHPGKVLLAVRTTTHAFVMAIDAAEWSYGQLCKALGWDSETPAMTIEKAKAKADELAKEEKATKRKRKA